MRIKIGQKTNSLRAWCQELKLNYFKVYWRINNNWSIYAALELSPPKSLIDKILENIDYHPESGCWNWLRCLDTGGYAAIGFDDKIHRVHRLTYQIYYGDVPEDKPLILHRCDNRKCCNPIHLYAGTDQDNKDDRKVTINPWIKPPK